MKRFFSMALAMVCVTSVLYGCSGGDKKTVTSADPAPQQQETTTAENVFVMKLANANPAGDIKDSVALKLAEIAEEKSNGRIKIEVYSGGSLGDWRDAIEGLNMGMNEIVLESIGSLDAYTPYANIDAVPYLYRDKDHFNKVWNGEIGQEIMKKVGDESGFVILGPMNRGARIVTSNKPFSNLAELKGLKIRVPNIQVYIETWKTLGAAPTPLALTETFTAIQQNTVEAQENPTIESYGHGFYDICNYLIQTNHVYSADMFIFDKKYFEGLPADIQDILKESIQEAAQWRSEETDKLEADYLEKFKEKGVEVIEPDREEMMAAFDGFVEKLFPECVEWANRIKEVQ